VTAGPAREPAAPDEVVVRSGDSLWSIAAATLPAGAAPQEVGRRWRAIYLANQSVVGLDPDVIHPGQRLRLPRPDREE
jgi:nucleoid-associated protein YgaU